MQRSSGASSGGRKNVNPQSSQIEEYVKTLNQLEPQLEVVENDLKNPTKERLAFIWVFILEQLGFDVESIWQPSPSYYDNLDNPELCQNLMPWIVLRNYMSKALSDISPIQICLQDVIEPKRKQTLIILKHLLNFLSFCYGRDEFVNGIIDEKRCHTSQMMSALEKREQLKQEREALQQELFRDQSMVLKTQEGFETAKKDLQDLQRIKDKRLKEMNEIKLSISKGLSEQEGSKIKIIEARQKLDAVKQKVASHSPQQLELRLAQAKEKKEKLALQQSVAIESHQTMLKNSSISKQWGNEYQVVMNLFDEVISVCGRIKDSKSKSDRIMIEQRSKQTKMQAAANDEESKNRAVTARQERRQSRATQHKIKLASLKTLLQQSQEKLAKLHQFNEEKNIVTMEQANEQKSFLDMRKEMEGRFMSSFKEARKIYAELLEHVDISSKDMWGKLDKIESVANTLIDEECQGYVDRIKEFDKKY